ncbi:helix-turn-helix domain-containing protein [Seramator thermalis]|uniref:helix-turn-helix domain-containing protein n=1 Tax=Seramator thermalis TaxID=2496270 RepID=UPI00101C75AA|nr:helix-turn-helix domain-containing protein [Seramator thermalis]
MATNFEYQKICKFCGNEFVAQKSTTKYCSERCAKRGKKDEDRRERLLKESETIKERNRQNLLSQENLSLTDAAALLSISRPTLYNLLKTKNIKLLRISKRTIRVKKSDLMNLYQNSTATIAPINTPIAQINKAKEEFISISEAQQQFKISLSWFHKKVRENKILPAIIEGKTLYPAKALKSLFAKKQYADISEWYTVAEIVEKFGVSQQYVYEYTSDHKMPKRREGKTVFISKLHWEKSRGLDQTESESYYTVAQATEKYAIGRSHLYDLVRAHKLPKIKSGKNILIHRQELDNIMNNRKR